MALRRCQNFSEWDRVVRSAGFTLNWAAFKGCWRGKIDGLRLAAYLGVFTETSANLSWRQSVQTCQEDCYL